MKMRSFGKLGIKASAFGMGCMRLPMTTRDGKTVIDEEQSIRMIRTAIDSGVNYVDTAYVYFNQESERLVGRALRDGYRERTYLATKLPCWNCQKTEDMSRYFEEQCKNLQTNHIDFYLAHALDRNKWDFMKSIGLPDFLRDLKAKGRISYMCFSFHDDYDAFEYILNDFEWDMCQIQLNFMDINNQAGLRGLKLAGEKNIPVVIMEGLLGGTLASAPDNVQALYDAFPVRRSPAEWAFRWLCNYPQVATVLSGVSNMEQTLDNLRIFSSVDPNCMSEAELLLIDKVREAYLSRRKIGCTGCRYCMPCPNGVEIPDIFRTWNDSYRFGETKNGNRHYKELIGECKDASHCVACGACETVCPQQLPIIEKLKQADLALK